MVARVFDSNTVVGSRDYSRLEPTVFNRKQLSALKVMVVGAGALGNEVLKNLALMGVGAVCIVDRDVIEASNLTRSVLYCVPNIAEIIARRTPKAEFAALRVREINPEVRVAPIVSEIAGVGLGVFTGVDLVFACLDNELARLELSWACQRLDLAFIDAGLGATNYSSGMVSLFPGSAGPCYACRKGRQKRRELLQELQGIVDPCWLKERRLSEQGAVSTTPLMASVVAGIQVEMGLRHVLGESSPPVHEGRSIRVTLAPEPSLECFSFGISPDCPLHESGIDDVVKLPGRSSEISVAELIVAAGAGNGSEEGVLSLDWPFTVEAECKACHHFWQPMMRKACFQTANCPMCASTDVVERETITSIDASSPLASRKLTELGLPLFHIHEVSWGGNGGEKRYVEISGDSQDSAWA